MSLAAHERTVRRGAIGWNVAVLGKGPGLLLLHGTASSGRSFDALAPRLAERFTVVVPDLPGHAGSTAPRGFDASLPSTAAAVEDLLDGLGVTPVVAVGHSAGAAVIARMTLDGLLAPSLLVGIAAALVPFRGLARAVFPPAARLLARSELAPKLIALRARYTDTVDRVLAGTGSQLDAHAVAHYRELSSRPEHVAAVLAMMASWDLDGLWRELPSLHKPFLLLAGENDQAVPLARQRDARARLPGADLVVVPGTGHLVHEEEPDLVARAIFDAAGARGTARLS